MCFVLSFNGQCKEMMSADLKNSFILHSQILHFLIFVYIKAKTLQPKPKTILANALPMFPVPMTPTVLPCKSKPRSPFNESFVLALDYMLYAFYDLKSISWPWRARQPGRIGRNDILLYLLLGSYNINIIKACTAQSYNFHTIFCQFLMTSASTTSLTKTHTIALSLNLSTEFN
jgi:hypothetical protein